MALYTDIDIFGREYTNGAPYEFFDEDAIKNALTLWLSSKKGEFLNEPDRGGILDRALFKNMDVGQSNKLRFAIRNALEEKFFPALQIRNISVLPDFTNRLWEISIDYVNPLTNALQSLSVFTKDLSAKEDYTYENIEYIDDNLFNFVRVKRPSMQNRLLIYDSVQGYWRWGRYLMINLSVESPFFDQILSYINLS